MMTVQPHARRGPDADQLVQVRRIIVETLTRGVPSIAQLANRLNMTERTLRRRLREQGCTYRSLVDATRRHLARSYVRDASIPLAEVSFLLGFAEPSAFHRAFKRWTQTTPRTFRDRTRPSQ